MAKSPYLCGIPHLPLANDGGLSEKAPISPADEAELDGHMQFIKRRIRERRAAWERKTGQTIEVEPPPTY